MARSFLGGGYNNAIYVDASDLRDKINICRTVLSRQGFEKLMKRTFNEVGKSAKGPIAKEAVNKYAVTQQWVKSGIKNGRIEVGGDVRLVIPLKSPKGAIGRTFHLTAASKRGKWVKARIVRGQTSKLPPVMSNQGGNPPFYNPTKGVVFTRRGPDRLPIVAVKGLGVPQLPLNRAADPTREKMLEMAEKRLEHNFQYMFK
jgi:hypothetical protein